MNYIAHIHLAHNNQTSLLGNFMGDFVKGTDLDTLPKDIQSGIVMHRKVDSFIDQHSTTKALKAQFPANIRRVSGIVLDVCYDHLLCKNWQRYCEDPLNEVLNAFYEHLASSNIELNPRYALVKQGLLRHRWLSDYNDLQACFRAYKTIEERLNNKLIFADESHDYIQSNLLDIEKSFCEFYPLAMAYTKEPSVSGEL